MLARLSRAKLSLLIIVVILSLAGRTFASSLDPAFSPVEPRKRLGLFPLTSE
jgi:hypothetical protein